MFITIEGLDGAGKTTQVKNLASYLKENYELDVLLTREPGGTKFAEYLRDFMKNTLLEYSEDEKPSNLAVAFLMNAARVDHIEKVISPHLKKENSVVICDRFSDSTIAYQGYADSINISTNINSLEEVRDYINNISEICDIAQKQLIPDITIYIDISVDEMIKRRGLDGDFFESNSVGYFQRVRQGFLEQADFNPDRFIVINGLQSVDKVWDDIYVRLEDVGL